MRYKIKSTLIIDIETDLEDTERPSEDTIKFLVTEDLLDSGYDVNNADVKKFEIEEVK